MEKANARRRIGWIDTMRGLALVLVVFGHQKPEPELTNFLQVTLGAVFFFTSGYVLKPAKYESQKAFAKLRQKRLVMPYFYFAFLSLVFWVLFSGLRSVMGEAVLNIRGPGLFLVGALGTFYGAAVTVPHNIPLWFLTCLFLMEQIFFWLHRRVPTPGKLLAAMLGLSLLGYLIGRVLPIPLPWNADIALVFMVYYGAGYLFRQRWGEGWKLSLPVKIILAAVFLAISVAITLKNGDVHPIMNSFGRFVPYHLSAATGVVFFMLLSQLIDRTFIFGHVGRNSMVVLGLHVLGLGLMLQFDHYVLGLTKIESFNTIHWAAFNAACILAATVPLTKVFRRYLPQMIGEDRRRVVVKKGEAK